MTLPNAAYMLYAPACHYVDADSMAAAESNRLTVRAACAGIVHLDLKSPNILLSKDWTAKIADAGGCAEA